MDFDFERVIEKLPPHQVHILTAIREQVKERERLLRAEDERRRTQTFERSH